MKKKIIALLLVFCLALCFAACKENAKDQGENNDNPAEQSVIALLNDSVKKSQELDAVDACLNMEMKISAEGIDMTVPLKADIKSTGLKGDNPLVSMVMTMSMLGEESTTEMYKEGEWVYFVADGMEYKMSASEMGDEYDYSNDINDMLKTIPEDIVKTAKTEKGSDGSTTFTMTVSGEKFTEIFADFLDGVTEDYGTMGGEVKVSDADIKITASNGYISLYEMVFVMDISAEGTETKLDVKAGITYNNPGQAVTVTAPEGYQDFEDLGDMGGFEDYEDLEDYEF